MRLFISDIELHGDKNESKKAAVEKSFFKEVNLKVFKKIRLK